MLGAPGHARALCGVLLLLVVGGSSAFAGRHKLQVTDPAVAERILEQGGHLVASYGGYELYEVDHAMPELKGRRGAENRDRYNVIELNTGAIDTSSAQSQAIRQPIGSFSGRRLHLVQFAGPVKPEWYQALAKTGVRVIAYIPNNAYLVYGDARALTQLQAWAGAVDTVQWDGVYQADYKIHPRARPRSVSAPASSEIDRTDLMAIQLVADADENPATLKLIDQLKLAPVLRQDRVMQYVNLIVRIPRERLTELANRPDVISIQPYVMPQMVCERQDQIIAGNLTGNDPTSPGYLAWLASNGFAQAQFDASGFVVDVADSGIDNGTNKPYHFGLYTGGNANGASRVVYNRLEGTPNSGSTLQGCDGHGNLNAHIIGGYDDSSGFPFADTNGFHYGLGVCPFVRLGSSVIFDPGTFTYPNYQNLIARAYRDGARVSNNSWGANTAGAYNSDSQQYDALVRDAQPGGSAVPNAGNQEIVIVFAAGNAGSGAMTVGAPGTAKNVITVGAGENVQAFGGSDGSGIGDSGADSANDIISFSSRGPCSDGRKKPDLCAPGTHVSGGVAQAPSPAANGTANSCYTGKGVSGGVGSIYYPPGQQFYTASSGTSHSTPCVAGGCALLRQDFINHFANPPSPAMTKAFLMNSARYMTGVSANDTLWSNNQGLGELNLGMAFDELPRVLRDQLNVDRFTASGQTRTFVGTVADSSKPFRVTLAWTDAPGATSGNAYNNDLDLAVAIGANTYRGNVFSGQYSTTGGSVDAKNNVESVFLPAGASGAYTVTVTAANINSDGVPNNADPLDQDFALVIYNGSETLTPLVAAAGSTLVLEGCSPTNGMVDPNETVTVDFALRNVGSADASNVVATLLATNGVASPSGPQTYDTLIAGGPTVAQPFTFTATGACRGIIVDTFQLQAGAVDLGTVTFSFTLGTTSETFAQNFDAVTAPGLPADWTTSAGGAESNWVTSTTTPDTLPNAAFSPDPASIGSNELVSTPIPIASSSAKLTFRNNYNLEAPISGTNGYDGGVLEIKIGNGAFQDILAAGGSFASGGYTRTISSSYGSPFAGRRAWSGNSGGFITTTVNLPAAAAGQTIQLRWRCATDNSVGGTGWYIDTMAISDAVCCTGPVNHSPVISAASINPSLPTTTNDLVATVTSASDSDGDPIALSYQWQQSTNGIAFVNLPGQAADTLGAAATVAGDSYRVVITPNDGQTNGTPFTTASVLVPADADGNDINDDWEVQYFGHIGVDPNADPDGDGFSNLQEFLAGTDPVDANSALRITGISAEGDDVRITWSAVGGKSYAVQVNAPSEENFTNAFSDLSVPIAVTGTGETSTNYLDAGGATNVPARFYRVRLAP
jgi:hypothetical protein